MNIILKNMFKSQAFHSNRLEKPYLDGDEHDETELNKRLRALAMMKSVKWGPWSQV